MTVFYPYDEASQCFIDEINNRWSRDGHEWHPRIGDPRMARKKKEQNLEDMTILEALATEVYPDQVVRPAHYAEGRKYEPWDVIADWQLDYFLGSALKYISRAGRKGDEAEDIRKAVAFLNKKLELLK